MQYLDHNQNQIYEENQNNSLNESNYTLNSWINEEKLIKPKLFDEKVQLLNEIPKIKSRNKEIEKSNIIIPINRSNLNCENIEISNIKPIKTSKFSQSNQIILSSENFSVDNNKSINTDQSIKTLDSINSNFLNQSQKTPYKKNDCPLQHKKQLKMTQYVKKKISDEKSTKLKDSSLVSIKQLVKINTILPEIQDCPDNFQNLTKENSNNVSIVNVYCDGSALNNGSKLACGGIGIWFGNGDEKNISEPFIIDIPTNQKTEIYALTKTLKILEKMIQNNKDTLYEFHIYTDSEYTIKCLTVWISQWKKNGWLTQKGENVCNKNLIEDLYSAYYQYRNQYKIHHVFAHGKDPNPQHSNGNNEADKLAKKGSYQHPNYLNKKNTSQKNKSVKITQ